MATLERGHRKINHYRVTAWTLALIALAGAILLAAEDAALHLAPAPIDGTFHMLNPIRRIAGGQRPGVDFQVYHGVLLPYAYYAAIRLATPSLFVIELVRNVYTALALVGGYLLVFGVMTRSLTRTVRLSLIAILVTLALPKGTLVIPGESELSVRSAPPLLFLAVLAWPLPDRLSRFRLVLSGVFLGVFVLLSTEQGVALLGGYIIVAALGTARARERRVSAFARLLIVLSIAFASFVLALSIVAGRGMGSVLRYNFVDVPKDQFWYFGALPSAILTRWRLFAIHPEMTVFIALVAANAVFWIARATRPRAISPPRATAMGVLSAYAVLSLLPLLARFIFGYMTPGLRLVLIAVLLVADVGWTRRGLLPRWPGLDRWLPEVAAVAAIALAVLPTGHLRPLISAPMHVFEKHAVEGAAVVLSPDWKKLVLDARTLVEARGRRPGETQTIWSTYSSLAEAAIGIVNPSFDYMVDALGPENRTAYLRSFRETRPALVQTINPMYSPFEDWNEFTRWDFYRELLNGYRVVSVGTWSIFWERLPSMAIRDSLLVEWKRPAGRPPRAVAFSLPVANEPLLLEAEIDYTIDNPWRGIPIASQLPRFLIVPSGAINRFPVPLAPYYSRVRFPVFMGNSGRLVLGSQVESLLPGASMRLEAVRLRGIPITSETAPWLVLAMRALTLAPPPR